MFRAALNRLFPRIQKMPKTQGYKGNSLVLITKQFKRGIEPRFVKLQFHQKLTLTLNRRKTMHSTFAGDEKDVQIEEKERPRLYREHNVVTVFLNDFSRRVFTADFKDSKQVDAVADGLESCIGFLTNHAKHEDEHIHPLLKGKGDEARAAVDQVDLVHAKHSTEFAELRAGIRRIKEAKSHHEKIQQGYQFKLLWNQLEATNMQHQIVEETVIMPALWKYCTDAEIDEVDAQAYRQMSAEDMVGMLAFLFPHMNTDDYYFFLASIKSATPDKFPAAFKGIADTLNPLTNKPMFSEEQLNFLMKKLGLKPEQPRVSATAVSIGREWEKRSSSASGASGTDNADVGMHNNGAGDSMSGPKLQQS